MALQEDSSQANTAQVLLKLIQSEQQVLESMQLIKTTQF